MKRLPDSTTIGEAKRAGRYGDQELVHLNRAEVALLENMSPVGLSINPQTGEREAFLPFLLSMLPTMFPAVGTALAGAGLPAMLTSPLALSAIGSGLGTAIETGDIGKGIMAGLGGAALGGLMGGIGGAAGKGANEAVKAAVDPRTGGAVAQMMDPRLGAMAGDVAGNSWTRSAASLMPKPPVPVAPAQPLSLMQAAAVGAPGAYLTASHTPEVQETDAEKRRKARIARAEIENFAPARQVVAAPAGYRPGFDDEHTYFRSYAEGGLIPQINPGLPPEPQINPGPGPAPKLPMPIGIKEDFTGPQINPGLGIWGGLPQVPRQAPRPVTPAPPTSYGGGGMGGMMRMRRSGMPMSGGLEFTRMPFMMQDQVQAFAGGGAVMGPGDGMSDDVAAIINGQGPAALSDGEYVIPADVVSALGNGSTKGGVQRLEEMIAEIRMRKTGKKKQPRAI